MSAVTAYIINADIDDEWLETAPIEALECRTLRHQWPRMPRPGARRSHGLHSDDNTQWKAVGAGEAGRLLHRLMTCLGGCGTQRLEVFLIRRDGRMVRDGKPRYRYTRPYLRRRADPDAPALPHLDQDQILGVMVHRLYPKLRW